MTGSIAADQNLRLARQMLEQRGEINRLRGAANVAHRALLVARDRLSPEEGVDGESALGYVEEAEAALAAALGEPTPDGDCRDRDSAARGA